MSKDLTALRVTTEGAQLDELLHWVYDYDENLTLCGIDATNIPWHLGADEPVCQVCELIDDALEALDE